MSRKKSGREPGCVPLEVRSAPIIDLVMPTPATATEPRVMASAAARLANRSTATINQWVDKGWLPCERTADGVRLFEPSAVVRVASARDQAKGTR